MADENYARLRCGCGNLLPVTGKKPGRPRTRCIQCKPRRRPAGAIPERTCQHCGTTYTKARATLYCSRECAQAAQSRKRSKRTRAERLAQIRNPANWFACEHCGKESHRRMSGTNTAKGARNRWCSMACKAAQTEAKRALDGAAPFCAYYAFHCPDCGDATSARHSLVTTCRACRTRRVAAAARSAGEAVHRAAAAEVSCEECGSRFCPLYGSKERRFCAPCAAERGRRWRKASKLKRKAAERGANAEHVDPIRVFERAGWRCYLCGCDTPRTLRGSYEPNAPELDHVVPLARGGAHTYANTACACRACNGTKSDRLVEELQA